MWIPFLGLLETYKIDATLLTPATPAVGLLDHLEGWQRIYADDRAVVHVRKPGAATDLKQSRLQTEAGSNNYTVVARSVATKRSIA